MAGRDPSALGVAVVGATARTTSGDSGALTGYSTAESLRAQLNVTAVAGTGPTLDVLVEDTLDGTNWNTIATFTQATAATRQIINVTTPFSDQVRVRWTIAGVTPSFTFGVHLYAQ